MDKGKMKKYLGYVGKYVGYAGLGYLGGLFLLFILYSDHMGVFHFDMNIFFYPVIGGLAFVDAAFLWFLSPFLGGVLGGAIVKKWWGAILGGAIGFGAILVYAGCKVFGVFC